MSSVASSHPTDTRRLWTVAGLTSLVAIIWLLAVFTIHPVRFVVFTPQAKTGFDVTLSLLSLFVALVLVLFPDEASRDRLRWVALGFAILGVGGLLFGYLRPLFERNDDLEQSMYSSIAVRTAAIVAIAIGMAPSRAPRATRRNVLLVLAGTVVLAAVASFASGPLPTLVNIDNLETAASESSATLDGLTGWHWALSVVPLALAIVAVIGVIRHTTSPTGPEWLVVAMVLMAGSQLHTMFWPSAYSPVLTTASFLRLAFTLVVAIGAMFALRQVAVERAAVLATERELARRLAELAQLRADFTAMVAHELGSPVAALRGYSAMLATGSLDSDEQRQAGTALRAETDMIRTLIEDVRAASVAERDDFRIHIQSVSLGPIVAHAAAYGRSHPGGHPVDVSQAAPGLVHADADRIGQVLRNLVGNACKHTPPGTPISIRTAAYDERIRIEVVDAGPGIHADDTERIFEKFGRGRDALGERVPGVGLGLYLSRRIIQLHGSELRVKETPGGGATFWFELPISR